MKRWREFERDLLLQKKKKLRSSRIAIFSSPENLIHKTLLYKQMVTKESGKKVEIEDCREEED